MKRRRTRSMGVSTEASLKEDLVGPRGEDSVQCLAVRASEGSMKGGIKCRRVRHTEASRREVSPEVGLEEVNSAAGMEELSEANSKAGMKLHRASHRGGPIQARRCRRARIGVIRWRSCRAMR